MRTEVWHRNPHNYIKELAAVPRARKVVWDRGMLLKRAIDPVIHGKLYFAGEPFECLVIGEQGTAHLDADHTMDNPLAVYPTWMYGVDDFSDLEAMVYEPIGEDQKACNTIGVPADELPVFGQAHRVVLTNLPDAKTGTFKALMRSIRDLVEEAENDVKLHLHGSYSFSAMFNQGMYSADVDPRTWAAHGSIMLPGGKLVKATQAQRHAHWIAALNMTPGDLADPASRCIFNIKSSMWAADNFERDLKFTKKGPNALDPRAKEVQSHPHARTVLNGAKPQEGDRITCNSCSLQSDCQYYREDSVCTLPDSETSVLAQYLQSRDSNRLIDAMGTMLGAQAKRLEKAVEEEEEFGEYSPEVTKMLNSLFANTMKLAKVIDPSLTKPQVQISVGGGAPVSAEGTPNQIVATAMRALEDQGVPRDEITSAMVEAMILKMTGGQNVIAGQVTS